MECVPLFVCIIREGNISVKIRFFCLKYLKNTIQSVGLFLEPFLMVFSKALCTRWCYRFSHVAEVAIASSCLNDAEC